MVAKGQSQLVTAVLLTGIMIVLVSSVYLWGVPLIQKQKDTVALNNMENFMKELDEKIQKVAANGGRERIENVKLPGDMKMTDNVFDDTISIEFETTGQLIATDAAIYLAGDNSTVVPVSQPAGSIRVFSEQIDEKYNILIDLSYREVISGLQSHKIDLELGGRTLISKGDHDIIITEAGTQTLAGQGFGGRDLFVSKVNIRFE